jgi:hypothetical protein
MPAHITRLVAAGQLPSTDDQPPLLLQVVLTLPLPVVQLALHTSPAAAGAQLDGQLAAFDTVVVGL